MIITLKELRMREVIRVCDGKSLGCVTDVRMDSCTGNLCSLLVMADSGKIFSFTSSGEICIPWELIRCIGDDVILVDIHPEACECQRKGKKCF